MALDLLNFEYPTVEELNDFQELLSIGRAQWKVELGGFIWTLGTLWEYEYRWIVRKLNNLDAVAKEKMLPLEILNSAIMEVQRLSDNKIFRFQYEANKVQLRHLLLSLSPFMVEQLYRAYSIGESQAKEEFQKKYSESIEKISKGFFEESGGFSGG